MSYHGKGFFFIAFEAAPAPATENFTKSKTFGKYTQQVATICNGDFVRLFNEVLQTSMVLQRAFLPCVFPATNNC